MWPGRGGKAYIGETSRAQNARDTSFGRRNSQLGDSNCPGGFWEMVRRTDKHSKRAIISFLSTGLQVHIAPGTFVQNRFLTDMLATEKAKILNSWTFSRWHFILKRNKGIYTLLTTYESSIVWFEKDTQITGPNFKTYTSDKRLWTMDEFSWSLTMNILEERQFLLNLVKL